MPLDRNGAERQIVLVRAVGGGEQQRLGAPISGGWPSRYAARRVAWHLIDRLWEMEDRRV